MPTGVLVLCHRSFVDHRASQARCAYSDSAFALCFNTMHALPFALSERSDALPIALAIYVCHEGLRVLEETCAFSCSHANNSEVCCLPEGVLPRNCTAALFKNTGTDASNRWGSVEYRSQAKDTGEKHEAVFYRVCAG